MTDEHLAKERLRRRLITGVILAAVSFAITALAIGKNWNANHTFGLIRCNGNDEGVLRHRGAVGRG